MSHYVNSVILKTPVSNESYLYYLPIVQHLSKIGRLDFTNAVTFLVGENASGKSTLLEAIAVACGFNAEGGTRNAQFSTVQTHSELYQHLTISKLAYPKDGFFLRAESFYNTASYLDGFQSNCYGNRPLHEQSHGESFLALVQNRFSGQGLYLLDEPEAALSPSRLLTLLAEIHTLVQNQSQFIIATHSPILMAYPGAEVFELSEQGIQSVDYQETEHFKLTKHFLEHPDRVLHYLLDL